MRLKNFAFLALVAASLFAGETAAFAQNIKGTVTDTKNQPIPGVSVFFKGTTTGVATDAAGKYSIANPSGAKTLVFSCLGMKEVEMTIAGKSVINVTLEDDMNVLEETVVIGYSTIKRKDLMGSVTSADSKAVTSLAAPNFTEALSGKMAGVSVMAAEGDPDNTVQIKVRGTGSITQDASPLYIVDGFPVNSISDLSARDIKSIDILKDAFSTAIYGSRGAYGVVLITTKDGGNNKFSVTYDGYYGWKKMANANAIEMCSPYEYARASYEYGMISNPYKEGGNIDTYYNSYFGDFEDMGMFKNTPANNWRNYLFGRTGRTQNHNINLNGRGSKGWWTASYNHMDESAIMMNSNFVRNNFTFKGYANVAKTLSFSFNARYSFTQYQGAGANSINDKGNTAGNGRLINALRYSPIAMNYIREIEDYDVYANDFGCNPKRDVLDNDDFRTRENLNLSGSLTWKIIKGMSLKVDGGVDMGSSTVERFYGISSYYTRIKANPVGQPNTDNRLSTYKNYRNTNTLRYDFANVLKDKRQHLDMLLGQEYIVNTNYQESNIAGGFPSFYTAEMARKYRGSASTASVTNTYAQNDVVLSFFGRANYSFDKRYSLSASLRADGSSKFADGHKWGIFPSAAASWDLGNEMFIKNIPSINQLKLRYSFGVAGNNRIPGGLISRTYSAKTDSANRIYEEMNNWVIAKSTMVNKDLTWEKTLSHNLGLDFAFFKTRLSGTVEAYHNTTKDLLINFPTSGTGYDSQYRNLGSVLNEGLEFTLRGVIVEKKNFGLTLSANLALNRNRVLDLGGVSSIQTSSKWYSGSSVGWDYLVKEGQSLGTIYGYVSDGWYGVDDFNATQTAPGIVKWTAKEGVVDASTIVGTTAYRPGAPKFKDQNGDGVINADDKVAIGCALPIGNGGFNIDMNFFGFDLSASFSYAFGRQVYNANKVELTTKTSTTYRNLMASFAPGKAWTNIDWSTGELITDPETLREVNKNATTWNPQTAYFLSSAYVENADFLRLNSLALGYTVPQALTARIHMEKLRVYVSGSNLFCLTPYSGYDPEVDTRRDTCLTPGVDYSAYPKSIGLIIGLNVTFK